jgi:hypothetical protein
MTNKSASKKRERERGRTNKREKVNRIISAKQCNKRDVRGQFNK